MHRYSTLISRAVVCTLKKQENSYNDSVSMEILEGYFVTVPLETSLEKKQTNKNVFHAFSYLSFAS